MVTAVYCSSVKHVLSRSRSTSRRSPTPGSEACWALVLSSWQCWAPSSCTRWASISVFRGQETLSETLGKGSLFLNNFLSKLTDSFPSQPAHNHHRCAKGVWTGLPVHNPHLCVCSEG